MEFDGVKLETLQLEPNDLIAISIPSRYTITQTVRFLDAFKEDYPQEVSNNVLFMYDHFTVSKVTEKQLNSLGFYRKPKIKKINELK